MMSRYHFYLQGGDGWSRARCTHATPTSKKTRSADVPRRKNGDFHKKNPEGVVGVAWVQTVFQLIFQHHNSGKLRGKSRKGARFLQNRLYPCDPPHGIVPTSDKGYNVRGHRERKNKLLKKQQWRIGFLFRISARNRSEICPPPSGTLQDRGKGVLQ